MGTVWSERMKLKQYSVVYCMRGKYYERTVSYWSFRKAKYFVMHLRSTIMCIPAIFIFDNVHNRCRWYGEYSWEEECETNQNKIAAKI